MSRFGNGAPLTPDEVQAILNHLRTVHAAVNGQVHACEQRGDIPAFKVMIAWCNDLYHAQRILHEAEGREIDQRRERDATAVLTELLHDEGTEGILRRILAIRDRVRT